MAPTVGEALSAAETANGAGAAAEAALLAQQANRQPDQTRISQNPKVRKNASQIAAAALYDEARARQDPGLLEEAAAHLEAAGGDAGYVEALDDETAERYGVERGARIPPAPLAGPQVVIGPRGERLVEVPDEVAAEMGLEDHSVQAPVEDDPDDLGELELGLPDEIAAILDEDDDEPDDKPEPQAEADDDELSDELDFADDEYVDPRVKAALARAAKAEKRAAHLERKSLKAERTEWVTSDAPHFSAVPQARAARIAAASGSRRAFLKAMKVENDELAPVIAAATRGVQAQLEAERARLRAQAREEARRMWGGAISDAGGEAPQAEAQFEHDQRMQMARARGGLAAVMKERMADGLFPGLAPGLRRRGR